MRATYFRILAISSVVHQGHPIPNGRTLSMSFVYNTSIYAPHIHTSDAMLTSMYMFYVFFSGASAPESFILLYPL